MKKWQIYLYDFCTNLWKSNFTQNLYKPMKLHKFVMNGYMIITSIQNVSNFHLICVNDSMNSSCYSYYPKVTMKWSTEKFTFNTSQIYQASHVCTNFMRKLIFISSYKFCTKVGFHKFVQKLYEFCVMVNMNNMFTYSIS